MLARWLNNLFVAILAWTLAIAQPVALAQEFFPSHGFVLTSSAGEGPAPANAFAGCVGDASNATTYNVASVPFGTEHSTRRVAVAITAIDSLSAFNLTTTSLTIGGQTATIAVSDASGADTESNIIIASVPTGTSGTVSLTYSEAIIGVAVCAWALYDVASATPTASISDNKSVATALTLSLNVSAGQFYLAKCGGTTAAVTPFTWTGATERADSTNADQSWTAADSTTTGTPLAVTCDSNAGSTQFGIAAVFD